MAPVRSGEFVCEMRLAGATLPVVLPADWTCGGAYLLVGGIRFQRRYRGLG